MRKRMITTAIWLIVLAASGASSAASAKEVMIRCTVSAQVTTTSKALDDNLNGRQTLATRHYILDDSKNAIWSVINGKRGTACDTLVPAECNLTYSGTAISKIVNSRLANGWTSVTSTNIDRLTGGLSETNDVRNQNGHTIIHLDMNGSCSPEALGERKF